MSHAGTPSPTAAVNDARVRWWIVSGLSHLALVLATGIVYALQFLNAYPLAGIELFSPGRVRAVHTSAVAFGFLGTLLIGLWEYVIPRLTGRPVWNQKLGWACLIGWNAIVVTGYLAELGGHMQAIEWGEFPPWLDVVVVVAFAALAANLLVPVLQDRSRTQYVSVWYFAAAMVWTALNYVIGNFVPQYLAPGAAGAAITSMYIHDLVGLLVTPLGWGLMYYMVPVALNRPVYSHRLSLVGFWMLAFFYPLNSAHHYLWSPIPLWVQHAAVVASVGVHVVIYTVAWNFVASAWGLGGLCWRSLPLRYFYTGVLYYLLTCVQCAVQVQLSVQSIIHFSDWVVGHAHFVMFGAFGLWALGFAQLIWPRLCGAEKLHSRGLSEAHWWLSTLGMGLMWVDLTAAGLVEGFNWTALNLFTTSIRAAIPFWLLRSLAGTLIALGQVLLFWNLWRTAREGAARRATVVASAEPPVAAPAPPVVETEGPARRHERARFVLAAAGAGSFLFAFLALALLPFVVRGHLKVHVVTPASVPAELAPYYRTKEDYKRGLLLGRDVYVAENCWNCHTQYVRPVGNDVGRYGHVATIEEYQNDMNLPQLFGTRRVGPDLSRQHGKHSNDWHFAHFYDPRLVVPESVMPGYPWLFETAPRGEPIRPNARGIALTAYVQWLGTEAAALEREQEVSR